MEVIRREVTRGRRWVIDADIRGFFDVLDREILMQLVCERISDRRVLKLLRAWLRAGVLDGATLTHPETGTPQGGVISPLLANLYLHWFDKLFHRSDGPYAWADARLVRYADDFVILARYTGGRIAGFVESTLEGWMKLKINRAKTRTVKLSEPGASLDFLGYTFRYDADRYGRRRRYLNVCPSARSLARQRRKLREMTGPDRCFVPVRALIKQINTHLAGWGNYFGYGYCRKAFRQINRFVRERLIRHLCRRSQRPYRCPRGTSWYAHLHALGLEAM
jgi:RNA-directed DNA polymerase